MLICFRSLSAHPIVIPTKVAVSKVTPANKVPPVVLMMGTLERPTHKPWKDWMLEELNVQGLVEWPKEEQEWARKLLVKWEHMFFTHSNLDLERHPLSNTKLS